MENSDEELSLLNSLGQTVISQVIKKGVGNTNKEQIDMSNLPAGIYTIHIKSSSQDIIWKVVRE